MCPDRSNPAVWKKSRGNSARAICLPQGPGLQSRADASRRRLKQPSTRPRRPQPNPARRPFTASMYRIQQCVRDLLALDTQAIDVKSWISRRFRYGFDNIGDTSLAMLCIRKGNLRYDRSRTGIVGWNPRFHIDASCPKRAGLSIAYSVRLSGEWPARRDWCAAAGVKAVSSDDRESVRHRLCRRGRPAEHIAERIFARLFPIRPDGAIWDTSNCPASSRRPEPLVVTTDVFSVLIISIREA